MGTIPSELGELVQLQELWMQVNSFNGTVPTTIGNMKDSLGKRQRNARGDHVQVSLTVFSFRSGYSSCREWFQWKHSRRIVQPLFTISLRSSGEQFRRYIQHKYRTARQLGDSSSVQKPADWSVPCAAREHRAIAFGMVALESFHRQCTQPVLPESWPWAS